MSPENIEIVCVLLDARGDGATIFAPAGGRVAKVTASVDRAGVPAGLGLSG